MAGGSKQAVMAAIGANALVTVAKFTGFALTGSGAMLAEGIHSAADVGNQALLGLGMARAARPADEHHPLGYTREAFVWAMISAVGIFFLGCGVTVAHGLEHLLDPPDEHASGGMLSIGILVFSLIVEGASLGVAVRVAQQHAAERGKAFWEHVRTSDDPFELAVLLEDSAAVVGVVIAIVAVGLTEWTHQGFWDPVGSLAVGLLLGFVALTLIRLNRALLVGRSAGDAVLARLESVLEDDEAVEEVATRTAVVVGSEDLDIRAEVEFDGPYLCDKVLAGRDLVEIHGTLRTPADLEAFLDTFSEDLSHVLGDEVDRLEARIREKLPRAHHVEIEPD